MKNNCIYSMRWDFTLHCKLCVAFTSLWYKTTLLTANLHNIVYLYMLYSNFKFLRVQMMFSETFFYIIFKHFDFSILAFRFMWIRTSGYITSKFTFYSICYTCQRIKEKRSFESPSATSKWYHYGNITRSFWETE